MVKTSTIVKGAIVGLLTCGLLEFIALGDLYFFDTYRGFDFDGFIGTIQYYFPLVIIFIVCTLLGVAIALKDKIFKKITIALTISLAVVVLGVYTYCIWFRLTHNI